MNSIDINILPTPQVVASIKAFQVVSIKIFELPVQAGSVRSVSFSRVFTKSADSTLECLNTWSLTASFRQVRHHHWSTPLVVYKTSSSLMCSTGQFAQFRHHSLQFRPSRFLGIAVFQIQVRLFQIQIRFNSSLCRQFRHHQSTFPIPCQQSVTSCQIVTWATGPRSTCNFAGRRRIPSLGVQFPSIRSFTHQFFFFGQEAPGQPHLFFFFRSPSHSQFIGVPFRLSHSFSLGNRPPVNRIFAGRRRIPSSSGCNFIQSLVAVLDCRNRVEQSSVSELTVRNLRLPHPASDEQNYCPVGQ